MNLNRRQFIKLGFVGLASLAVPISLIPESDEEYTATSDTIDLTQHGKVYGCVYRLELGTGEVYHWKRELSEAEVEQIYGDPLWFFKQMNEKSYQEHK